MKYNILFEGPYLTQSGYGEHARLFLDALKENENLEIFGIPLPWGQTSWLSDDTPERQWLDDISLKISQQTPESFDLHVFVGIPSEFRKKAHKAVCVTAGIETDRVDPKWLMKSHELEKILVPSEHSKRVFENSGYKHPESEEKEIRPLQLECPIDVIPYANRSFEPSKDFNLNLETSFNFLSVAQWGPRKNMENTIKWFVDEFKNNKNVGLVLKTGMARNCNLDHVVTEMAIKNTLEVADPNSERKCKVYLLHGDLTSNEMGSIYKNKKIKGLVSATHGEGFGLPIFEAACSGLPVIAPNVTGHVDFLYTEGNKQKFLPVEFTVNEVPESAVWDGIIPRGSRWYFPEESSFRKQMRELYKNHSKHKSTALELSEELKQTHSLEIINKKINTEIMTMIESDLDELDIKVLDS